jgi:hypothetical protein
MNICCNECVYFWNFTMQNEEGCCDSCIIVILGSTMQAEGGNINSNGGIVPSEAGQDSKYS